MFVEREGKKYILLNGLCSPVKYGGRGIGQELVNTLIRVGKAFDIDFIKLDCKGDKLMNYYKKFGFVVTNKKHLMILMTQMMKMMGIHIII